MKYLRLSLAACAAALLPAGGAVAHPHIFADTALTAVVGADGRLQAVEVTWAYDEFYSMLVFEDRGLDGDYDGVLTADELAGLAAFDMQWVEGFQGDTYLSRDGAALELGPPEHLETTVKDGRIITRHRRAADGAPLAAGLELRAYDPTFYTAYKVADVPALAGDGAAGCRAELAQPDLDKAYALSAELQEAMPADAGPDEFPEVGAAFAATVRLICGE